MPDEPEVIHEQMRETRTALAPLRKSVTPVSLTTPTVWLAAAIVVVVPFAVRRGRTVYMLMRRHAQLECADHVRGAPGPGVGSAGRQGAAELHRQLHPDAWPGARHHQSAEQQPR